MGRASGEIGEANEPPEGTPLGGMRASAPGEKSRERERERDFGGGDGVGAANGSTGDWTLSLEEVRGLQSTVAALRQDAKLEKLAASTVAEYSRRWARLCGEGADADLGSACKRERYLWKAAAEWGFKTELQRLFKEADAVRSDKTKLEPVRMLGWKAKVQEMKRLAKRWDAFRAVDWSAEPALVVKKQTDHKKAPATDLQLEAFHALRGVQVSQYRPHFLAAEFCGARPEEFGGRGLGVEVVKVDGQPALRFWIDGAKQGDGSKGQPHRTVVVPRPTEARASVVRRWDELFALARVGPQKRIVLTVAATASCTAGMKLSRAFSRFAGQMEAQGAKLSMYSLRNRFSAQAKDSNPDPVKVAELLGQQSTETQRHYGRSRRGKSWISPVQAIADGAGTIKLVRQHRDRKANPVQAAAAKAAAKRVAPVAMASKLAQRRAASPLAPPRAPRM